MFRYTIRTLQGHTGRDHLLAEIASQVAESKSYKSKRAAIKGGERALVRVLRSRELYKGLFAGFEVSAS